MQYQNNRIPNSTVLSSNVLPQTHAQLSTFNLSESLTTTIKTDYLYPCYWQELNPNDHFEVSIHSLARLMPLVCPVMSNVRLKFFAFFVPNRLLWEHWENFQGAKNYQSDKTDYQVPYMTLNDTANITGSLADYLGVPPVQVDERVSALPFRAYNKIWNEWFRANQLQEPVVEYADDGNVNETLGFYKLLKKGKPLDYFTSCLPYPQASDPVTIPLTGDAVVRTREGKNTIINTEYDRVIGTNTSLFTVTQSQKLVYGENVGKEADRDTNLYADMSNVTGISIEALRQASALQVLLERDARSGERYIDLMHMHFATDVPDFLVGRAQYLGSTTTQINVEPIAQTSETGTSPQANLSALGIGVEHEKLCEISTVEHGIFMILCSVEGDVTYQQGLDRKFSKRTRFDYMYPEFWHLGDQVVKNKELFLSKDKAVNDGVFGYTERYREYREGVNRVSGLMRSNTSTPADTLDVWHLAQKFANTPKLNGEFIQSSTPLQRSLALPSEDSIVLNVYFDVKATRNLPVTSNPSMLAGRV